MIDLKDLFENNINQIWSDDKYKSIPNVDRGFASVEKVNYQSLLFIGLNPSFNEKENVEGGHFYDLQAEGNYKYFKKFEEIARECEICWSHLDLLFYRCTNQKEVDHLLKSQIGRDFIYEQLLLSKQMIELSRPKIIVVNNTLARYLMGKNSDGKSHIWMGFEFEFSSDLGTYVIKNHSLLSSTPVFFTSMLTGQAALDIGSFERLIWHIKKALIFKQ